MDIPGSMRPNHRIVLSTVSSDSHTWNLVYLQMFLEEHGNEVVNLGPCVPDEYLVAAARRHRPDLVVVSSISGHGLIDGCRLIRTVCRDPVVRSIPVVIGGKLGISGDDVGPARELLAAGFAAVFTGSSAPGDLLSYLDGLRDGRMSVLAAGRA